LAGGDAVDGHDFPETAVFLTVEEVAGGELVEFEGFDEEVFGFEGVAENVVVVDVIDLEAGVEGGGFGEGFVLIN
jgi:hypothetical protein